jgi:hypothetical protein
LYSFSRLKAALKGQRFSDATDMRNATEKLKSFYKAAFKSVSNSITAAERNMWVHKETILKEM